MDERDMEEVGKNREGEGRGIGIKKVIFGNFGIVILCLVSFIFMLHQLGIRKPVE
jgi:hypothetical protein